MGLERHDILIAARLFPGLFLILVGAVRFNGGSRCVGPDSRYRLSSYHHQQGDYIHGE